MIDPNIGATRPCASSPGDNDYFGLLQRPESAFRTARDGSRSYTSIDDAIIDDERLSMESKAIMPFLLRLPDDWEHSHLVLQLCKKFRRSDPTIRKYVEELTRCGYLHRFLVPAVCRGGEMKWRPVYKITEVSMPRPEGYTWDEWIPLGGRHASQVQAQASLPGHRRKTFGLLKAGPSKPSKILVPYKGERRRDLRSSDLYEKNKNPLPLLPKGDDSFELDRVVSEKAKPVSRAPRQTSPRAVVRNPKPSTPAKQAAPCPNPADFNASRRPAVVPADGFESFVTNYRDTGPAAFAAIQRAGNAGSAAWVDAVLANPLVAMLQQVLGYAHWDYHNLKLQCRRIRRGSLKPWEIVLLWCAKNAESSVELVRDAKPLLEGLYFRKTPYGKFDMLWDERMRLIRNGLTDAMFEPLMDEICRMVSFRLDCPCHSATDEGRDVREQAAWWLNTQDDAFFREPGARAWFLGALDRNTEFFAGLHPLIGDDAMPADLRAVLDARVAEVTPEALQAWRENVIAKVPLIPGGFRQGMREEVQSHRLFTPDHIIAPIMAAIEPALPEFDGWMPDLHHLLDVGNYCDES